MTITNEMVERAAMCLHEDWRKTYETQSLIKGQSLFTWENIHPDNQAAYRRQARVVLDAALDGKDAWNPDERAPLSDAGEPTIPALITVGNGRFHAGVKLSTVQGAIDRLAARLTAIPLPEEIAVALDDLQAICGASAVGPIRAALQAQAREIERLQGELSYMIDEVARSLRGEIERLNIILGNHGVTQLEKTEIMLDQAARIAEIETERDALKELVSIAQGHAAEFARQANAMKNERDAIRPTTIEECGKLALAYEHPNVAKVRDSGSQWLAGHDGACLGISAVIRALNNQPVKPSEADE